MGSRSYEMNLPKRLVLFGREHSKVSALGTLYPGVERRRGERKRKGKMTMRKKENFESPKETFRNAISN